MSILSDTSATHVSTRLEPAGVGALAKLSWGEGGGGGMLQIINRWGDKA